MERKSGSESLPVLILVLLLISSCSIILTVFNKSYKRIPVALTKPFPTSTTPTSNTNLEVNFPPYPTLAWKETAVGRDYLNSVSIEGDTKRNESIYLDGKIWSLKLVANSEDEEFEISKKISHDHLAKYFDELNNNGWVNHVDYSGLYLVSSPAASGPTGEELGFIKSYELNGETYFKMVSYSRNIDRVIKQDPTGKAPYLWEYPILFEYTVFESNVFTGTYLKSQLK